MDVSDLRMRLKGLNSAQQAHHVIVLTDDVQNDALLKAAAPRKPLQNVTNNTPQKAAAKKELSHPTPTPATASMPPPAPAAATPIAKPAAAAASSQVQVSAVSSILFFWLLWQTHNSLTFSGAFPLQLC